MIQKIRTTLLSLMAVMAFAAAPALISAPVYAQANINDSLCSGANLTINGSTDCAAEEGVATDKVNSIITNVINIFSM